MLFSDTPSTGTIKKDMIHIHHDLIMRRASSYSSSCSPFPAGRTSCVSSGLCSEKQLWSTNWAGSCTSTHPCCWCGPLKTRDKTQFRSNTIEEEDREGQSYIWYVFSDRFISPLRCLSVITESYVYENTNKTLVLQNAHTQTEKNALHSTLVCIVTVSPSSQQAGVWPRHITKQAPTSACKAPPPQPQPHRHTHTHTCAHTPVCWFSTDSTQSLKIQKVAKTVAGMIGKVVKCERISVHNRQKIYRKHVIPSGRKKKGQTYGCLWI